jgi:hypothetical protein
MDLEPKQRIDTIIEEVESDPTCVFLGLNARSISSAEGHFSTTRRDVISRPRMTPSGAR